MKDFLDNDLIVGDEVVFMCPNYRFLIKGTIVDFTPQKIRIEYNNTWNFGPEGYMKTFLATSDQVMKLRD